MCGVNSLVLMISAMTFRSPSRQRTYPLFVTIQKANMIYCGFDECIWYCTYYRGKILEALLLDFTVPISRVQKSPTHECPVSTL